MPKTPGEEVRVRSGKEALKKLDTLFDRVSNVSNAAVRERMAEEKRKNATAKKRRGRPRKSNREG